MTISRFSILWFCILSLSCVWGKEPKRIAIVRDGDSPYFDAIIAGFEKELSELASDRYQFELVDEFNAQGDSKAIRAQLLRAIDDPRIDAVYTAGIIASHRAQDFPQALRKKPVVAGAVEFSNFDHETISETGTSTVPNFTFILEARRVPADLKELSRMSGKRKIHAIIDGGVIDSLSEELAPRVKAMEKLLDLDVVLIRAGTTAEACLASLPTSTKVLYIPVLPSLRAGERAKLFEGLARRKVMSFSMFGEADVRAGALASLSSDNARALFRRTAINFHQILSGVPTSLLPVVLRSNDRLRVNMKTAKQIGWSPDYDTLLSAELIQLEAIQRYDETLTLEQAMSVAARGNADVRVAQARTSATYWETQGLRTGKRPQVSITGSAGKQGIADRINPLIQANTDNFTLGAEISQLLYSDRLTSQIRANEQVQEATKLDLESVRLDSMQEAGLAYLDCLQADALYAIDKENLSLAIQNLNLAKTRRDIGAAEPSEVFRWQATLAEAKAQLIQRDADQKNARLAFNIALGQRAAKNFRFRDISLADDEFYLMDEELAPLLTNLDRFESYTGFVKTLSLWRSPELKAFDKNLNAQGILLRERGRRNFRPEVKLTASARRFLTETSQNYDAQGEWSVGIGFSIPLGEGGLRKTEKERIGAVIRQLEAQRDRATYLVEQRALTSVYRASASHPNVRLSREAKTAAEKNYQSVQDKYSRGAAAIIDLIDAQSQLVLQRRAAAAAKYNYLKDIIAIQRAMAWFEFSRTKKEKALWTRMLRNYLQTGSLHTRYVNKKGK